MFLFLLGKSVGAGLLVYVVSICLVFEETDKLLSKVSVPFAFPPVVYDTFSCTSFLSALGIVIKKNLAIFNISLKIGSFSTFYSVESLPVALKSIISLWIVKISY